MLKHCLLFFMRFTFVLVKVIRRQSSRDTLLNGFRVRKIPHRSNLLPGELPPENSPSVNSPLVNSLQFFIYLFFPEVKFRYKNLKLISIFHWFTFIVVKYSLLWGSKPWDLAPWDSERMETSHWGSKIRFTLVTYPEALLTILTSFLRKIVPMRTTALHVILNKYA